MSGHFWSGFEKKAGEAGDFHKDGDKYYRNSTTWNGHITPEDAIGDLKMQHGAGSKPSFSFGGRAAVKYDPSQHDAHLKELKDSWGKDAYLVRHTQELTDPEMIGQAKASITQRENDSLKPKPSQSGKANFIERLLGVKRD